MKNLMFITLTLLIANSAEASLAQFCLTNLEKVGIGTGYAARREEQRVARIDRARDSLHPIDPVAAARFDQSSQVYNAPEELGRGLRTLPPELIARNGLSVDKIINAKYRVLPDDSGRPIRESGKSLRNEGADGFIWVLTLDHRFLVSDLNPDSAYGTVNGKEFKHTSFTGGQPVLGAGKISMVNGKMKFQMNEETGHYGGNQEPGRVQKVIEYLESVGFAKDLFEGNSFSKP